MVNISAISKGVGSGYKYSKQILKATPELLFGTGSEVVGGAMRNAYKSGATLKQTAKIGLKELNTVANGNFFSKMCTNLKNLVPDLGKAIKDGGEAAKLAGKSSILGSAKGLVKGIGKKLPFIFAAFMVLGEVPNIIKATKEKGIWQGIKETIKPVVKLVGAGIGSVIGTTILQFGGSIAGWMAGEWLAGKLVGKSYSDKKALEEQQAQEMEQLQQQAVAYTQANPQVQQPQQQITTTNPYATIPQQNYSPNPFYGYNNQYEQNHGTNNYSDDIFMKQMNFNTIT